LKDIPGYSGLYSVSQDGLIHSHGRVKRGNGRGQHSTKPQIMKAFTKVRSYPAVNLVDVCGKMRQHLVHKLVANAFCIKPKEATQVNHKDLDRTNNYAGNLEWVTAAQNVQHAKDAGVLCGGGRNRFNSEQVDEMRKEYFNGRSLKEVAKQFNCGEATVWRAVHKVGRNTKHLHYELKD